MTSDAAEITELLRALRSIEKSLYDHRVIRERVATRGLKNVRLINHEPRKREETAGSRST